LTYERARHHRGVRKQRDDAQDAYDGGAEDDDDPVVQAQRLALVKECDEELAKGCFTHPNWEEGGIWTIEKFCTSPDHLIDLGLWKTVMGQDLPKSMASRRELTSFDECMRGVQATDDTQARPDLLHDMPFLTWFHVTDYTYCLTYWVGTDWKCFSRCTSWVADHFSGFTKKLWTPPENTTPGDWLVKDLRNYAFTYGFEVKSVRANTKGEMVPMLKTRSMLLEEVSEDFGTREPVAEKGSTEECCELIDALYCFTCAARTHDIYDAEREREVARSANIFLMKFHLFEEGHLEPTKPPRRLGRTNIPSIVNYAPEIRHFGLLHTRSDLINEKVLKKPKKNMTAGGQNKRRGVRGLEQALDESLFDSFLPGFGFLPESDQGMCAVGFARYTYR